MSTVYFTRDFFLRDWRKDAKQPELWVAIQPHVKFGPNGDELASYLTAKVDATHNYQWIETSECQNSEFTDELVPVSLPTGSNLRVDLVLGALQWPIEASDIVDPSATSAAITALPTVPPDVTAALSAKPPNLVRVGEYLRSLHADPTFAPTRSLPVDASASPRQNLHTRRLDFEAQFGLRTSPNESVIPYTVDRSKRLQIADSIRLAADNREPQRTFHDDKSLRELSPTLQSGPFAQLYNEYLSELLQSHHGDVVQHRARIRDQLRLAFWIGTRRFVRVDEKTRDDDHLMRIVDSSLWSDRHGGEAAPRGLVLTNLHALTGLLVRLYPHRDVTMERLREAISMQVAIEKGDGPSWIGANPNVRAELEDGATTEYFRTLVPDLSDVKPTARLVPKSDVAYANFGVVGFTHIDSAGGAPVLFSRAGLDDLEPTMKIRQLVVTTRRVGLAGDLTWTPYGSFHVDLVRYRNAPMVGGETVVRVVPSQGDAERFRKAEEDIAKHISDVKLHGFTKSQPLRAYSFRWDGGHQTLLTWGKPTNGVRLLIARGKAITTQYKARARTNDVGLVETVDEWRSDQFVPANNPVDGAVDVFECRSGNAAADLGALSLSALVYERDTFELACGASRSDLEIAVEYPASDECATHRSFTDDAREDVINYNTLNAHIGWADPPQTPVNPWGHVLPSKREKSGSAIVHTYQVRHIEHFQGPVTYGASPPTRAQLLRHFREQYLRVGWTRKVSVKLQHSYGVELNLPTIDGIPTPFDFVPFMPTDVADARSPSAGADERKFITFHVDWDAAQLKVKFRVDWRTDPGDGKPPSAEAALRQRDALRALVEMAHATNRVTFAIELQAFDVQRAIRNARESASTRLADGLVSTWVSKPILFAPTPSASDSDLTILPDGEITLGVDRAELAKCHAVRATLTIERTRNVPDAESYKRIRRVHSNPATDDRSVQLVSIPGDPVEDGFKEFIQTVGKRTIEIPPSAGTMSKQREVIERLGFRRPLDAVVVVPMRAPDARSMELSVGALGFLPIGDAFGAASGHLVETYFRICQIMIDCAFVAMSKWSWSQWTTHFEALSMHAKGYSDVIEAAAATIIPVIPGDADNLGAIVDGVVATLGAAPGRFAETKAFLHLRGTKVPSGFAGMVVTTTNEFDVGAASERRHKTSFTYRDAVATENPAALHFLDPLAIHSYGNSVHVESEAFGVEQLLLRDKEAPIRVVTTEGNGKLVRLPSRRAVVSPIHLFSRELPVDHLANDISQDRLLKDHQIAPVSKNEPALRVHGLQARARVVERGDDEFVESHLFVIEGDRDVSHGDAFSNDTFGIDITGSPGDGPSATVDAPALLASAAVEQDLRDLAIPESVAEALLGPNVAPAVIRALGEPPKFSTGDMGISFRIHGTPHGFLAVLDQPDLHQAAIEVLVLEAAIPAPSTRAHPVYLLIRRRTSVWEGKHVHLRQRRNYEKPIGRDGDRKESQFDKRFRTEQVDASRAPAYRHFVSKFVSWHLPTLKADAATGFARITVAEAQTLLEKLNMGWREHALAVTVFRKQYSSAPRLDANGSHTLSSTLFPVQLRRLTPAELQSDSAEICELPRGEYRFDWQWFTAETNAPFFRLGDTRVDVQ